MKSCRVLNTKSMSSYRLITGGALVTATKRAGSLPEPLKCWCQVLSGMANSAPAFHSKVMRLAGVVPDRGRTAAVEHVDHFLEQLALRRELSRRRDFAHVAVVGGARRLVIDEHAAPAAPRPGLERDRVQVRHVVRADDVQALAAHPAGVRRVLLGGEFLRQLVRNDCASLPMPCS